MSARIIERLSALAAIALVVLVVAACAIRMRDDEAQTNTPAPVDLTSDPLATKLTECRSITYEQKDALSECRKAWAEKRRQFLGQKAAAPSAIGADQAGSSLFVMPKDESRVPPGIPSIQQPAKE